MIILLQVPVIFIFDHFTKIALACLVIETILFNTTFCPQHRVSVNGSTNFVNPFPEEEQSGKIIMGKYLLCFNNIGTLSDLPLYILKNMSRDCRKVLPP